MMMPSHRPELAADEWSTFAMEFRTEPRQEGFDLGIPGRQNLLSRDPERPMEIAELIADRSPVQSLVARADGYQLLIGRNDRDRVPIGGGQYVAIIKLSSPWEGNLHLPSPFGEGREMRARALIKVERKPVFRRMRHGGTLSMLDDAGDDNRARRASHGSHRK